MFCCCCCCHCCVAIVAFLFSSFLLLIFRVWENEKNDSNFNFPSAMQYVCVCVFIYTLHISTSSLSQSFFWLRCWRWCCCHRCHCCWCWLPLLLWQLLNIQICAEQELKNKNEGNYTINQPYMKFVEITKSIWVCSRCLIELHVRQQNRKNTLTQAHTRTLCSCSLWFHQGRTE